MNKNKFSKIEVERRAQQENGEKYKTNRNNEMKNCHQIEKVYNSHVNAFQIMKAQSN